jgi:hypothetical protein
MKAVRREWDEGLIRSCLYPHDVEEVLKIRLSNWNEEDFIAWHYEKSGMFSVRSAYKLALQLQQSEQRQEGSSRNPDGSRLIYKDIWSARVPPKVRARIFAWRLLHDGLATQLYSESLNLIERKESTVMDEKGKGKILEGAGEADKEKDTKVKCG